MEENKLVVKNLEGEEITITVVDIIEDEETKKQFICYRVDGLGEDELLVSTLEENESSYNLGEVTDEERAQIEELMNQNDGE